MKKLALIGVMMMVCGTAFAGNFFHPCTSTAYQYCSNKLAKKVTLNSGAKGEGIPYQTCQAQVKSAEFKACEDDATKRCKKGEVLDTRHKACE